MELNDKICPTKDLLSLICQDDVEGLRKSLLSSIHSLYPNSDIYLYEHGYSVYDASNNKFNPLLIACKSKNDDCIEKAQLLEKLKDKKAIQFDGFKFLPTDDYIQVFTTENERSNRGLLITINKTIINEDYISTLLEAYNHQILLLRNKDTDSLTGLYNRQSFDDKLKKLHESYSVDNRSSDETTQICFAILDIDFFKKVNDKYGHIYGDEVLILFSNIMKNTFRDEDLLFRYGGEEFAVLLKNITLEQAEYVLNRFRKNVEAFNFPMENKVTTSIGYCEFNNKTPLSTIVEHADKALYYSKEHGRNLTSCFETLMETNKIQDTIIDEGDIELF